MDLLMYVGLGLFVTGLVLSHIVLAMSRQPKREGRKLPLSVKVLMWGALGLTVVGLVLGGLAVVLA